MTHSIFRFLSHKQKIEHFDILNISYSLRKTCDTKARTKLQQLLDTDPKFVDRALSFGLGLDLEGLDGGHTDSLGDTVRETLIDRGEDGD
jgi:hypothetical protein